MRIWHEKLIPLLCRQHLLAMWREGLGAYSIIVNNKKGYRNHPAVKEFEDACHLLWSRLFLVRKEMLKRDYHPKPIPKKLTDLEFKRYKPWQTLKQQKEILKNKDCECLGR